jgi:hypothetical protein
MKTKTHDENAAPAKGFTIEPPPQEIGPERLYRVVYMIDVNGLSPRQAAERAYEIMKDPESMRPVLDVLDATGERMRVDLSEV